MSTTPQSATPAPSATPSTKVAAAAPAGYEKATAEEEGRWHNYVGHRIPWYVRVLWLIFWIASAYYVVRLLLPALDTELLSPP